MASPVPLPARWRLDLPGADSDSGMPDGVVGRAASAQVPATVPGCAHTDLLAAGLIPDPYLDRNEEQVQWIGRVPLTYTGAFDVADVGGPPRPGEHVELVFTGVDTVADLTLDGRPLGSVRNQHRTYRFDVTDALAAGDAHEVVARFAPQLAAAETAEAELGARPHSYEPPFNAVRKSACNFGWDWGPSLVTAGLWRPVLVQRWESARFGDVCPLVTLEGQDVGRVSVRAEVVRAPSEPDEPLEVVVSVAGARASAPVAGGAATVDLRVPGVDAWWPVGFGAQPLYDLVVELRRGATMLERSEHRVGFRRVELDTSPDAIGSACELRVNGARVYLRGANWIPRDCFPSRLTPADLADSITQALDANVNLLRVWGGGLYEDDAFYAECDRRGVLVWQDFLFACAGYAEEEPLRGEVEAEARENVARLSAHPSLVLWCGNNENLWAHEDWGWKDELDGASWGLGYYTELLPGVVAELDPTRPYLTGSPSSPAGVHPNADTHGPMHLWDVWNDVDYTHYRDHRPRLAAEFGYQGPPTWATLTRALHDEPLAPDSPGMLAHQKAEGGNDKLHAGIAGHLPVPTGFEDWHWAMSLQQAHAITFALEWFRSLAPRNAGAIVWQLDDCWPVTSWAMVDGDGRRKPLWYAVRSAYAPRLLTHQPGDHGLDLVASNETDAAWAGTVTWARLTFGGDVLATATAALEVPPRGTGRLPVPAELATPADPRGEALITRMDGGDEGAVHFFAPDLELALAAEPFDVEWAREGDATRVTVSARTLAKDVTLLADKVAPDAVVDSALVTLAPGQAHTFTVTGTGALSDAEVARLADPRVLRSANDLVGGTAVVAHDWRPS